MKRFLFFLTFVLFFSCEPSTENNERSSGLLAVNGTTLYHQNVGDGKPLLIIHGGPGLSHDYLVSGMQSLSNSLQLIMYDQRGSGRSALDVDPSSMTISSFVSDIDAIRQQFDIDRLNILAHSWGGLLAMHYAIAYPDKLENLVLVNSINANPSFDAESNRILADRLTEQDNAQRTSIFQTEAFQRRDPQSIETLMKIGFKHQFYDKTFLDSLDLHITDSYSKSSELLQHLGPELSNYDLHQNLSVLEIPTLLIYGSFDPLSNVAAHRLNETFQNSELVILPNCGHFPFIECNDAFTAEVLNFLH